MENTKILILASTFSLSQYVALVEVQEENLASHKYVTGKGKSNWIGSSNNCGQFCLILYQNLTSDTFFKVSCCVESETVSMNFSYSVTLKPIGILPHTHKQNHIC